MGEPDDVDIHARGGGRCPYCHFALKSSNVVSCPGCGAGHHPECWEENGGCAVLGCGALAESGQPEVAPPRPHAPRAITPPRPQAPPLPPPAVSGPSRRSSSLLPVAVALAVIAVAGAVAAIALTRDSTPTEAARTVTAPAGSAAEPTTGDDRTAPTTPASARVVRGPSYSVRIPAGFERAGPGVFHQATRPGENSYTESQWRSTEDAGAEIHIDYTKGFQGTVENAARGVRLRRNKGPTFREYAFGSTTREDGSEAWRWHFSTADDGVDVHRVAYYMAGCDTGYAFLGIAPAGVWDRLSSVFEAAAATLRPRC